MKQNGTSRALTNAALLSCRGLTDRKLEGSLVEGSEAPRPFKTSTSLGLPQSQQTCLFCNENGENLRRVATHTLDRNVRAVATKLQDRRLLTKLAAGDMPGKLTPWMLALDLTNYSRWLPAHIRDLMMLK